jgi:hypothetical protein
MPVFINYLEFGEFEPSGAFGKRGNMPSSLLLFTLGAQRFI